MIPFTTIWQRASYSRRYRIVLTGPNLRGRRRQREWRRWSGRGLLGVFNLSDTLLKRLMVRIVDRINRAEVRPAFLDILNALDSCYLLLEIEGDDGGTWLYLIQNCQLQEKPLAEAKSLSFREKHFYLSMPDWTLYDILLKQMTPAEAVAYAQWGGSAEAHPSWVFLSSSKVFEMLQLAVSLEGR
mgnify:FL=1